MSSQNNRTILMYGFDKNTEKIIEKIGKNFNVDNFKVIKNHMTGVKIRDILEGNLKEQDNFYDVQEKVVLFNDLTDRQISGIMSELKSKVNERPILAVVTETSIDWSFNYLLDHLLQERAWFEKNNKVSE
ncbi:DUF3783 domain-containing protein [Clostridium sp. Mt-5]|uniref:DUF3783 domain-containing protein n=1 Tax=Clostridium moutaii TaxID=3240932 RepID=A0ABV4BQK3_9CLOT